MAIFDQGHGRFIMLDPVRKLKAEVKTDDVRLFADTLQGHGRQEQSRPFMKFAADPDFDVDVFTRRAN